MSSSKPALVLYSPYTKKPLHGDEDPNLAFFSDPEKVRSLEDRVERNEALLVLIDGGRVLPQQAHALHHAIKLNERGNRKMIKVYAREEGVDTKESVVQLKRELSKSEFVQWRPFDSQELFDEAVLKLGLPNAVRAKILRGKATLAEKESRHEEGIELRQEAIALVAEDPPSDEKANDYLYLARCYKHLDQVGLAEDAAAKALRISELIQSDRYIGLSYEQLALVLSMSDAFRAEGVCVKAVEFLSKADDKQALSRVYRLAATIYRNENNLNSAKEYIEKYINLNESLGREDKIAFGHAQASNLLSREKRYKEAISERQLACEYYRRTDNSLSLARNLAALGNYAGHSKSYALAYSCLREAEEIFSSHLDTKGAKLCRQTLRLFIRIQRRRRYYAFRAALVVIAILWLVVEIFRRR